VVVKLTRPLPAFDPTVLSYADGNFGQPTGGLPHDLPQVLLVNTQRLVVLIGLIAFIVAAPPGHRLPRRLGGWVRFGLALLGLLLLGLIGWIVYTFPALRLMPPEQIAQAVAAGIPRPDPARLGGPEQAALAERGRYLFTVASCALCHGNDGSGGLKFSWRPFGTLWARNITTDRETGIGTWSNADIARAIRSGLSRNGRVLHWQGMIWDHASNWDEEDLQALVVYLRTLPPMHRVVPPPRPPAADDCRVYTFWIASSREPGCK
jgi:mono/diheme cytochrome c family protein